MGIATDIASDWDAALAALDWQLDCGVDEAIAEAPVNRYAVTPAAPIPRAAPASAAAPARVAVPEAAPPEQGPDPVALARALAEGAATLEALREAMQDFDLCELKKGARNTVFADGNPLARVLVLGEPPSREEDQEGRPFAGRAGQLLDAMFAAIGLSRHSPDAQAAIYVIPALCWRPMGAPAPEDLAMMRPFLDRHIALIDPAVIVTMGETPLTALTGKRGVKRLRGDWLTHGQRPLLPMLHPDDLLRRPEEKRAAWADLLALQARLRQQGA